jgi:hypothetical protein
MAANEREVRDPMEHLTDQEFDEPCSVLLDFFQLISLDDARDCIQCFWSNTREEMAQKGVGAKWQLIMEKFERLLEADYILANKYAVAKLAKSTQSYERVLAQIENGIHPIDQLANPYKHEHN